MTYTGFFIVFEGPNAAGKSTAMRKVAEILSSMGHEVVSTREPGGSPLAEHLRGMLLDPQVDIDAHEQALLLMAGRRNHIRTVIKPALDRGAIVLCDRFVASTLVYQTVARGSEPKMSIEDVVETHRLHCFNMAPDLQLHLTINNEVAQIRKKLRFGEIDRFESDDAEYEQACIDLYAKSGHHLGFNQIDIDANGSPEETVSQIMDRLSAIATGRTLTPMLRLDDGNGSTMWYPEPDGRGRLRWLDPEDAKAYASNSAKCGHDIRFINRNQALAMPNGYLSEDEIDLHCVDVR